MAYKNANMKNSKAIPIVDLTFDMPNYNIVVTATFKQIDYTVTFKDDNNTTVSTKTDYHYGDNLVLPNNPTKAATTEYSYSFAGWTTDGETILDLSETTITDNITYIAKFTATKNQYTVTFVDEDGETELQQTQIEYGQTPEFTQDPPTKAADNTYTYTFAGWDKQLAQVTGNTTYTAVYTPTYIEYEIIIPYNVTIIKDGESYTRESQSITVH